MTANHDQVYGRARYYDIAFGYRDFDAECAELLALFDRFGEGAVHAFLELAAGPARHAIAMARACGYAAAIDCSPEMVAYGRELAADAGVALDYHRADMRDVALDRRFDLSALLLDSASYLLTNDDVYAHLSAIAGCLRPGGLHVLQLQHPAETFRVTGRPPPAWDTEVAGETVRVEWGHAGDPFDPVTQQTATSTTLIVTPVDGEPLRVDETAPHRCFAPNELRALIDAAADFELAALLGTLDPAVPLADANARYMVAVLRRR